MTISLKCYVYRLKAIRQITLKQALFGENYKESSTTLIVNKAEVIGLTPEAIFTALFAKCLINHLNLKNIDLVYSGADISNGQRMSTYWLYFFDYPLDEFNNPDISQSVNPNNF
ncbi:MAG: hypothetical protein RMZ69_26105 [Nostoc sp. ChiQUE01a]|nr:hypothetical protein [Nostoc sp. DcaGUA01]MDZ8240583.1 hypothetical protein [Nostoc sp. ChiQUE01a]